MKYNLKKYLILSFGLAWIFQIIGSIFAVKGSQIAFSSIVSVAMLMPMVAVLIIGKGFKKEKTGIEWKPKFKGKWKYWLISWLSPIVLCLAGALVYFLIFPQKFDATFSEYIIANAGEEAFRQMTAVMDMKALFPILIVQIIFAAFINMLFALGEEAGWRGYMQPALKEKFGVTKGRIIGGLIWGAWHWPVIAIAGYEYGWSAFNSPWYLVAAGMLLFPVITVVYGIIADWTYEKAGSIWAPSLWHGAINAAAAVGVYMLKSEYANEMYLGPAPIGIIGVLPFLVMAAAITVSELKKERSAQ